MLFRVTFGGLRGAVNYFDRFVDSFHLTPIVGRYILRLVVIGSLVRPLAVRWRKVRRHAQPSFV